MLYPELGPGLPISSHLAGTDSHLLPAFHIPEDYDPLCNPIISPIDGQDYKVAPVPGNPDILMRWDVLDYSSALPSLDAHLEEGMLQWKRFDEAGMPVVAHQHVYAESVEEYEEGLLATVVERLHDAEDLDLRRREHLAAATTALSGLITYTHTTLGDRTSFINWDSFKPHQLSVISPSSSVRKATVNTLAYHDLGLNFTPTYYDNGAPTRLTQGCIKMLGSFGMKVQATSRDTEYEDAATTAVKTIADEFGAI
jgi:hypothetical protein